MTDCNADKVSLKTSVNQDEIAAVNCSACECSCSLYAYRELGALERVLRYLEVVKSRKIICVLRAIDFPSCLWISAH